MDINEANALARKASNDIEAIVDELFNRTGINVTGVEISAIETTSYKSESRQLRHLVTLTATRHF